MLDLGVVQGGGEKVWCEAQGYDLNHAFVERLIAVFKHPTNQLFGRVYLGRYSLY